MSKLSGTIGYGHTPDDVYQIVKGYPNMSFSHGKAISSLLNKESARHVLELGFNWGVSSCYIAAAIGPRGGSLVTIDRASRAAFVPGIEGFLTSLGLVEAAVVFYEAFTYNWRLRAFLRLERPPVFDLIFVDGAHLFEPDALAFILAERMLRAGGLFVFDDYNWTISNSPHFLRNPGLVSQYSNEEKDIPHVKEVFELLVQTHANIQESWVDGPWAYARKRTNAPAAQAGIDVEQLRAMAAGCRAEARQRYAKPVYHTPP